MIVLQYHHADLSTDLPIKKTLQFQIYKIAKFE